MAIFKLSSILIKTKARWDVLIMFSKITKGLVWAKYGEIENFETVAGFSIFPETGSES